LLSVLSVALVQPELRRLRDVDDFGEWIVAALEPARGADLVVLPELVTLPLLTTLPDWRNIPPAEFGRIAIFTGAYLDLFRHQARSRDQRILAGTHLVRQGGEVRNVAHVFLPDGSLRTHAKTHLTPRERLWGTVDGESVEPIEVGGVRIGVAICYEAEIPEISTILCRRGADVVVCPSYNKTRAGYWRIRRSGAARCVENLVYFLHCPLSGHLGDPLPPGIGEPSVLTPCDPRFPEHGVLVEGAPGPPQTVRAVLDLETLRDNRLHGASTVIDRRRRSDLYRRYEADLLPSPGESTGRPPAGSATGSP
jgi:predicted amidohydrolase